MCHLDVVVLSGRSVACGTCGTCGARGSLGDDFKVSWNDFSGCVITKAERSEHYQEIPSTPVPAKALKANGSPSLPLRTTTSIQPSVHRVNPKVTHRKNQMTITRPSMFNVQT